ncbi:MAG: malonyl-ACP O-methyltransferase BioC [Methylococcales bacterium]|nr:malonyl-ACP O-methyltransferase BioC [Methylococcales bacterium]MDD5753812.1 malonyl-ACP O-methyltransferase BioC [Methylococcales bacterium]
MALDKNKIKQSFGNASLTYDSVAELQRNVGRDLLQTFLPKNLTGNVVDLGCGTGFLTQELLLHCIDLIALDLALPMLQTTREKLGNMTNYICADAERLPFRTESINTVFSNLALQWCQPIDKALSELHRVLKPNSELIFSTFGCETLHELKTAWQHVDDFAHVNTFYTASQLQSALEKVGFSNVEIKNLSYVSRYDSVLDLMRELKRIGAHNVNSQRHKNLTSKKSLQTMITNYPRTESGEIVATFDVICIVARR